MAKTSARADAARCAMPAWVAFRHRQPRAACCRDISDTGARLEVDLPRQGAGTLHAVADGNGNARRTCRVVWRKPHQIGVKFERRLPATAARNARAGRATSPPPSASLRRRRWPTPSASGLLDRREQPVAAARAHEGPQLVASSGVPPSTTRPLARSTMLSLSEKRIATVAYSVSPSRQASDRSPCSSLTSVSWLTRPRLAFSRQLSEK